MSIPGIERLPPDSRNEMVAYITLGQKPSLFLYSVLINNFTDAVGHATDEQLERIWDYANWLVNYAPLDCWGSEKKVSFWIQSLLRMETDSR